jgi:pheromone shutdown protein TraB
MALPISKRIGGYTSAAGALLIVLLIFAIIQPTAPDVRLRLLLAWLLMSSGFTYFIAALRGGGPRHLIFKVVIGGAYLIGALYSLTHPALNLISVTFPCKKCIAWSLE